MKVQVFIIFIYKICFSKFNSNSILGYFKSIFSILINIIYGSTVLQPCNYFTILLG